jgi:hypothetical protein
MRNTFKATFCEHYGCKPEHFETVVFRLCLHRRARLVAWLLRIFRPDFFNADFTVIRHLGNSSNIVEAMAEIDAYNGNNSTRGNFWHDTLRFRVSGKRLQGLAQKHVPAQPEAHFVKARTRQE